jgi:hypothetical protein
MAELLLTIDDVPWDTLSHGRGPATDVPAALRDFLSPEDELAQEAHLFVLSALWDQGSIFPATPHALPFLVELLGAGGVACRGALAGDLALIAFAASTGASEVHRETREVLEQEVPRLLDIAARLPALRDVIVLTMRLARGATVEFAEVQHHVEALEGLELDPPDRPPPGPAESEVETSDTFGAAAGVTAGPPPSRGRAALEALGGIVVVLGLVFVLAQLAYGRWQVGPVVAVGLVMVLGAGAVWVVRRRRARARFDLAMQLRAQGQLEEAFEVLEALRASPHLTTAATFSAAVVAFELWRIEASAALFQRAAEDPSYRVTASGHAAMASVLAGIPVELPAFDEAEEGTLRFARAMALARAGQCSLAREGLKNLVILNPLLAALVRAVDAFCIAHVSGEVRPVEYAVLSAHGGMAALRRLWPDLADFIEVAPDWEPRSNDGSRTQGRQ